MAENSYARARVWQDEARRELQRFFTSYFAEDGGLQRVLDAGAGYELPLDIPLDVRLTALDLSEPSLAKNANADEKIVGDVQTYAFPAGAFDAVICWWVLEHLPQPRTAIGRLASALRRDGLLVLGIPYLWGFKALVTKATPYAFHVWLARKTDPRAGTPGVGPYPTFLRHDLSPGRLASIARAHGLEPAYSHTYSTEPENILPRPLPAAWKAIGKIVRVTTAGHYNPLMSEHIAVFKKT